MKTSDLRNCAGVGRDKLEARLKACADLIDIYRKCDIYGSTSDEIEEVAACEERFEKLE